jgi:TetR/AcrR family transcriptional regulator, cholesterol catabolism regulator
MVQTAATEMRDVREEIANLKRERIVEAAAELFFERGYAQTTLDDVARMLGFRKPFIYAHFKSKTELLAEIAMRGMKASIVAIDSVADKTIPPAERFRLFAERYTRAILDNQMYIAIGTREEKNLCAEDFAYGEQCYEHLITNLTAMLTDGAKIGVFKFRDARLAAQAACGLVAWSYMWKDRVDASEQTNFEQDMIEFTYAIVGFADARALRP